MGNPKENLHIPEREDKFQVKEWRLPPSKWNEIEVKGYGGGADGRWLTKMF